MTTAIANEKQRVNPGRVDPTRTKMLRKQFEGHLFSLFRNMKSEILEYLVEKDSLNLSEKNRRKGGNESQVDKIIRFEGWLEKRTESVILRKQKVNKFIVQGYNRGFNSVNLQESYTTNARRHVVAALQRMALRSLKGVTDAMKTEIMRVMSRGIMRGMTPRNIATEINRVIGSIGINRARVLAQTEIVRAHAEATLDVMEMAGITHVQVNVEWKTAGDLRVCDLCKPLQGLVLPLKKARGLIPRHPRCRCAFKPTVERPHKAKTRSKINKSMKAEIPKSLRHRRKSAKQQRRRSRWLGRWR